LIAGHLLDQRLLALVREEISSWGMNFGSFPTTASTNTNTASRSQITKWNQQCIIACCEESIIFYVALFPPTLLLTSRILKLQRTISLKHMKVTAGLNCNVLQFMLES